jgi:phosphatidylglycerophosphate synthase
MLYLKRKHFEGLSKNLGVIFSKFPISANQWTLLSLVFAMIFFYFIFEQNFLASFFICTLTISVDIIDGAVARATSSATKFGAYLDTTVDRFIEFFIIFGLFFVGYPAFIFDSKTWLIILLFGSMMSTYSKSAAFEKGLTKKLLKGGGILEHTDRLLMFLVIILISYFSLRYAMYLIVITTVLTFVSFLQRFFIATKGYK